MNGRKKIFYQHQAELDEVRASLLALMECSPSRFGVLTSIKYQDVEYPLGKYLGYGASSSVYAIMIGDKELVAKVM